MEPCTLDHLLWGGADLPGGERAFREASGVALGGGGAHPGKGTRNNLASFGPGCYFELIAPDPEQPRAGRGADLAAFIQPRLYTFAVRGPSIEDYAARAAALGLDPGRPEPGSRRRADGVTLAWTTLAPTGGGFGAHLPFLIDWQDSSHPSTATPEGLQLIDFAALHPRARELAAIYEGLGVTVPVYASPTPGFLARLRSPRGEVVLT